MTDLDVVRRELIGLLKGLPYPAYLTCLADCLADLRAFHGTDVSGPGAALVDRTLELIRVVAAGRAAGPEVTRLKRDWLAYRGVPEAGGDGDGDPDDDDDDLGLAEVDLPTDVHLPAFTAVVELSNPALGRTTATSLADAAYRIALWSDAPGDNSRLLREFIERARGAAAG